MSSETSQRKTVLITGATSGIGEDAVKHLAQAGYHVIATGRSQEKLERLVKAIQQPHVDTMVLEVTDGASIRACAEKLEELAPEGLHALVNNAGYSQIGAMAELPLEKLRDQFETNVFGLVAVTQALLPALRRAKGRVVNVSSVVGYVAMPLQGAYAASKHALEAITHAMRMEFAPLGVEVVSINPGPINTGFLEAATSSMDRDRAERSLYRASFARADAIARDFYKKAPGPEVVSRAIDKAISLRRPKARYIVPPKNRMMILMNRYLPRRVVDRMFSKQFGLDEMQA